MNDETADTIREVAELKPKPRVPKKATKAPKASAPDPATRRKNARDEALADEKRHPRQTKVSDKKPRPTHQEPVPARNFTGHGIGVLAALFVATAVLTPSLRVLLSQQEELTQAQQQLQAEKELNEELKHELNRWEDPAFVQQQARERFNMVMPGERKYLVINGEPEPDELPVQQGEDAEVDDAWADQLWGSFIQASQND